MKRITLLYLCAGLLTVAVPALRADETTNQAPATVHKGGGNREYLHAIGLNPKDLKGLSKEDRQAKIHSAAEATLSALQQKQTAGTITDQEKTDLALIEKHLQHTKKTTAQ